MDYYDLKNETKAAEWSMDYYDLKNEKILNSKTKHSGV